jgi:hypothetical protein
MIDDLKFEDLSPAARALICNGAGPSGLGWLIPDLWFTEAANRHDFDYWQGGSLTFKVRADVRFWANSLLGLLELRWWQMPVGLVLAHVYFLAVSFLGWFAWHWCRPVDRRGWADLYALLVAAYGEVEQAGIREDRP